MRVLNPHKGCQTNFQKHYIRYTTKNIKKPQKGFLREIYNINIINILHLNRQITKTQTLKELIESDPRMGKLEIVYENCFMWTIRENDIEFVRQKLGIDNDIFIH